MTVVGATNFQAPPPKRRHFSIFDLTVSKIIYLHITLVYALIKTRNGITAPTLRSGEAPCGCLVEANASTKFGQQAHS